MTVRHPAKAAAAPRLGVPIRQAAAILGVSPGSLRRWADKGDLRCVRTPGNQRRFTLPELERFIAERGGEQP